MKAALVVLFAVVAMVIAQDTVIDPAWSQPSIHDNIDPGFSQPSIHDNIDPGFSQPSIYDNYQKPNIDPVFVDPQDQYARDG